MNKQMILEFGSTCFPTKTILTLVGKVTQVIRDNAVGEAPASRGCNKTGIRDSSPLEAKAFTSTEGNRREFQSRFDVKIEKYPEGVNFFSESELIRFREIAGKRYRKDDEISAQLRNLFWPLFNTGPIETGDGHPVLQDLVSIDELRERLQISMVTLNMYLEESGIPVIKFSAKSRWLHSRDCKKFLDYFH